MQAILFTISKGATGLLAHCKIVKEDLISWARRCFTAWREKSQTDKEGMQDGQFSLDISILVSLAVPNVAIKTFP